MRARLPATATSGSSSTSSRTPTRSRSSWPCGSPRPADAAGADWRDVDARARPAVLRRRPEAVDLPLPPRRHRDVPRAAERFGPSRPPHRQLPVDRAGARVDQSRLRPSSSRPRPARSPAYRAAARRCGRARRRGPHVVTLGNKAHVAADGERPSADDLRASRSPTWPRSSWRSSRETWPVGDETERRARLGDIVRAAAGAHVAARSSSARSSTPASRTGPRRARSCTARREVRDLLAGGARHRRPHRRARARDRAALAAVRMRRRRPLRRSATTTAAGGIIRPTTSRLSAGRPSGRRGARRACRAARRRRVDRAERAARRASCGERRGARARLRRRHALRDVWRRAALRHRPGPGVERGRGHEPARLPRVGRPARAPRARGSSRPSCPRPTTTRCAS